MSFYNRKNETIRRCLLTVAMPAMIAVTGMAQTAEKADLQATVTKQVTFPETVPAGNYSGITWLGGNEYAVVSDKATADGFFIFHINIDPDTGVISHAYSNEYRNADRPNRDMEGIAYVAEDSTVFISGEADNRIMEYRLKNGMRTGRELEMPDSMSISAPNYGYEALTYCAATQKFWTMSESTLPVDGTPASPANKVENRLRLLCFDKDMKLTAQYPYRMDMPVVKSSSADMYAMGVSALCALDDGRLLVLEREAFVPKLKIGAFVNCKIYVVDPDDSSYSVALHKKLLTEFKTRFTGLAKDFANYEGMCLGPKLNDGSQVVVMISDSQNQYKGVMKDWLRTVVIK